MAEHATAIRERPAAAKPPVSPTRRSSHVGPTPAPFHASLRGGVPLHGDVADPIGRSLGIDVSGIRVHTDGNAAAASRRHGALAFAYGPDIFLGAGQRPNDLPLMAHEVAHVVQQRQAPRVQLWTPSGNDRFEREAGRAASAVMGGRPFTIVERTLPVVQRGVVDDIIGWATDNAYAIPGFRLLTIVLGFNPLTGKAVERSPVNILSGLIEVLPGGALVTTALNKYGILAKVAAWVEQQFHALGDIGGSLLKAISDFTASLGAADLLFPGAAIDRALNLVHAPIKRIHDFGLGLLTEIVNFVRDAVLRPLGDIARQQSGWDLLCAVLGKDPITGDKVERTAENLIGGFMKLIGHEEVWTNIKAANAGPRAFAWFQGALSGLMGFVQQIPSMFIGALKALELADLIDLPSTFLRFAKVFGSFALRFISWATDQIIELLKIVVQAVAPKAMPYLEKAAGAFKDIINNPMKFVGNLISAAKLGFQNFAANFLEHLKAGLLDWLTGSLPGVYIPKAFTLPEIFKLVVSVLGLTWENIRGKLVKVIGDTAVKALETGFEIVVKLVRDGPAAAWEEIKGQLSNLRDSVIGGIVSFVTETIVQKAIPQVISLFIPGAGFITAIVKIYDTIMVFVNKISKIIQVVTNFIDSISAIAAGAIGGAAKKVESTLENLLSLAINFLAGFIGLGKVSDKIKGVLEKIRGSVDKAIDWLINWIVTMAKKVGRLFSGRSDPAHPEVKSPDAAANLEPVTFTAGGESHRLWMDAATGQPMLASSTPVTVVAYVVKLKARIDTLPSPDPALVASIGSVLTEAQALAGGFATAPGMKAPRREDAAKYRDLVSRVHALLDLIAHGAHTGMSNDPLPITWLKPRSAYQPITLYVDGDPVLFSPYGKRSLYVGQRFGYLEPRGNRVEIGIESESLRHYRGENIRRVGGTDPVRGTEGVDNFKRLLEAFGWTSGGAFQIDHVLDLGFGGMDFVGNLWPLSTAVNAVAANMYLQWVWVTDPAVTPGGIRTAQIKTLDGLHFRLR